MTPQSLINVLKLAALVLLLQGCAASTQLIHNDKASDAVKTRSFKSYKHVVLIPPKEDPRNVVPRAVAEFKAMGFAVSVADDKNPVDAPQGTGFVITPQGHVLTCAHVLGNFTVATLTLGGKRMLADVLHTDKAADLALLKLREPLPEGAAVLGFRSRGNVALPLSSIPSGDGRLEPALGLSDAKAYSLGEDVFTIGYPLSRLLGNSARMSKGLVSATAGIRDDPKQVQVSAEIQPGNSGGPLLDREGNVLGVIQQTLNPARVQQATGGALPQNVNFAIKVGPALDFVRAKDATAHAALRFDAGGGLDAAGKAVAKLQAGNVPPDSERRDQMVVRLTYQGQWDVWYRFRVFVLAAFDYETQETLFVAGQGRDSPMSNEEGVIKDTFDQFRKAIASR